MLYKRLIIDGQELPIAVCQCGKGEPTAETEGCTGIFYTDTDTGDVYKCISDDGGACKWERMPCSSEIEALQKQVADILYTPISISSFRSVPNVAEIGATVNSAALSWSTNKAPDTLTLDDEEIDAALTSLSLRGLGVTADKSWTLKATDERGATATSSAGISFLNGVYYGVVESGAVIDSAAVRALARKLQSSKTLTFTVNAGAGQQIAYALPTRYGTPTFKDVDTGFQAGFYLADRISFTNASGYTEAYSVWLSTNTGLGNMKVSVS